MTFFPFTKYFKITDSDESYNKLLAASPIPTKKALRSVVKADHETKELDSFDQNDDDFFDVSGLDDEYRSKDEECEEDKHKVRLQTFLILFYFTIFALFFPRAMI